MGLRMGVEPGSEWGKNRVKDGGRTGLRMGVEPG